MIHVTVGSANLCDELEIFVLIKTRTYTLYDVHYVVSLWVYLPKNLTASGENECNAAPPTS